MEDGGSAMLDGTCDVLVVGAGPTGLLAANLLKRSGVDVRIVEKRLEASRESRAFAVQSRTIEVMQTIGLADEFLARGVIANGVDIHVRGKRRGGLDLDRAQAADTPFQFILMIPQSETEAILSRDLERLGVTIERGVEVESIAQDKVGVTTQVRDGGGRTGTIRSRYIIGADGSRSIVRKESGLDFEGGSFDQSFLLTDCQVDWPLDHHRFRVFVDGPLIGLFLPLDGRAVSRVMTNDPRDRQGDAQRQADVDLAEIEAVYARATGQDVKLSNPVWVTSYTAHHRETERYRAGRAFVGGDAAHIHSPAGGQGMNTGLQDVANLAWKMALVLKNHADDELLDDYHDERKPVGDLVVRSTGRLFNAFVGQTGWKAALRDWLLIGFLPVVSQLPPFQRNAFYNLSQRAIGYANSRFVADGPSWTKTGPRAGERAPNAPINRDLSMFDLLKGYAFTLVGFSRKPLSPDETAHWKNEMNRLAARLPSCRTELIARVVKGHDSATRFVDDATVFDRYGFRDRDGQRDGLYLIRPDTYVAWRCTGLDVVACKAFLNDFAASDRPCEEAPRPLVTERLRHG